MHSLRIKITAITIAAILASFVAFAFASFRTVGERVQMDSAYNLHLLSKNLQESLDNYLDSVEQSVEMVSHITSNTLDAATLAEAGIMDEQRTPEQTARLDASLAEHCARVRDAFASVANNTNGVVTYYYCISPDASANVHGFCWSKAGKAGFEELAPLDASKLDPNDLEHNAWYFVPIERGRPSWVGPYKSPLLGDRLTISYLTPIYKAGTMVGVLGMDVAFDTLVSNIRSIKVYDTGYACLLDPTGHVLYHPDIETGGELELAGQTTLPLMLQRRDSGTDPLTYQKDGESWQLSFATLSNGMKLVVTAPTSEVTASWSHLMGFVPIIAGIILAIFIPFTLLAVGRVIKPLRELTAASTKLSAGDYDVALDYEGRDEVGVLTNSFRQMRDHLKAYISDLNGRVYVDALTRVKNKGGFDVIIARLDDAIRSGEGSEWLQFALVMFDCNGLKSINDRYGHERGDIYLQKAAQLICQVFTHSPVYRVGGDEFVVLLEREDFDWREELLATFDAKAAETNDAAEHPWERIDIAKGVASYRPGEDESAEQVLRRADTRMYENKRSSR